MCGLTRSLSPAARAAAFTTPNACWRASRRPRSPMKSGPPRSGDALPIASSAGRPSASHRFEPVERDVAHRDQPLAIALADDPDEPAVERQLLDVEPERLADPEAGGVEQLEERPSAEIGRRLEQPIDLIDGQRLRQQAGLAWQVDVLGDVDADQPLPETEAVEAADARGPAAKARRSEARIVPPAAARPRREIAQRRVRRPIPLGGAAPGGREVVEVAAVCADGRRGEAALDAEVGEEVVDRAVERRSGRHVRRRSGPATPTATPQPDRAVRGPRRARSTRRRPRPASGRAPPSARRGRARRPP